MGLKAAKESLTASEAADIMGCHVHTVYRLIERGKLPAFRLNRNYRIALVDFREFRRLSRVGRVPLGD